MNLWNLFEICNFSLLNFPPIRSFIITVMEQRYDDNTQYDLLLKNADCVTNHV